MPKGQFKRPVKYNSTLNYDKKITIRVNSEKLELIKKIANEQGIRYNKLIRDLIDMYIESHNKLEPNSN